MAQIRTRETAAQVGDAGTITNNEGPLSNSQIDQNFINLNNDIATRLPISGGTLTGTLSVPSHFTVQAQGGEGGEIVLKKGTAQTSLAGDVILDTLGEAFRVFENGGNFRQIFFNLTNGNITGANGISINIDGNAATVTNGVYTTGNQTISGTKTFTGTTILGGGSSFIENPTAQNSWFSTAAYGTSQGDNRTHFGYHTTTPGVYYNYIRGAKTFVAADLEVAGTLTNGGNQILHAGNYSTYAVANNGSTWTPHPSTFRSADWNYFYTDYGYISFGPANNSWAHIYSDKNFYFNQGIWISGNRVLDAGNYSSYALPVGGKAADTELFDGNDSQYFLRLLTAGTEASIDSYTQNGFRLLSYSGHSRSLLTWDSSGSSGTIQQEFHYNTPTNGWRIRNKTDNTTWSDWGYVALTTANQGHITGTLIHTNNYGTYFNGQYVRAITTLPPYQSWNVTGNQTNVINQINQENFNVGTTGNSDFPTSATYKYGLLANLTAGSSQAQIYISHNGNDLIFRGGWGGASWQAWNKVLTDQNYSSYSLPIVGGTLTGSRPITFDTTGGDIEIQGDSGGWATGLYFRGSAGTFKGGFGALGSGDSLSNFWIGPLYDNAWLTISSSGVSTSGNLTVAGNLIINGTTTTVNSTVTTIDDPIITLGGDTAPTTDDNKDRGIEFRWHNGSAAKIGFFGFDDSTGYLTFIPDATNSSEVFSGTKGTIDAYLDWSNITNNGETLATVTGRGATTSTNVSLLGTGNHFSGHFYLDSYDAAGNHYPHFNDGPNGTGSIVNWRLFTGSTNTTTHVWTNEYTQFNNSLRAPSGIISGGNQNSAYDATLLVTATNNNDWAIIVDKNNADATEYGIDIRVGNSSNYAFRVLSSSEAARITGAGGVLAKVFYDIDNTGYYIDPASTDLSVRVLGEICNSNYAVGNMQAGALNIGRTDTDYSYTGTTWSSDIRAGILANCSETWEFIVHDSGDSVNSAFYFDGGARFMLGRDIGWGSSYIEAPGSFRSSYFYDSSNTNYYWKPNTSDGHRLNTPSGYLDLGPMNTSHCHFQTDRPSFYFNTDVMVNGSYRIYGDQNNRFSQGALVLRGTSPTVYLRDTNHMSAQLHVNDNTFYILRGGVDEEGWTQLNNAWPLELNLSDNNAVFGGIVQAVTDVRAPIFYDRNDTNYYVDPAGTSRLNVINTNIYYQAGDVSIGYLHAEASASIAAGGSNILGDGVQQDLLAFNPPNTAETWNGTAWSSATIPNTLFAGRLAQAFGGFDLTPTNTKVRFTWNSFGYRFWHALNAAHTTQGNNIRFTLETSTDGTTWVNHGTSGWTSSWPGYSTWTVKGNNSTSAPWMRITVERDVNNQNNVTIGCINLMGSYGGYSKLFDWDYQRNVTFYNTVQAVDFNSTSDVTKKKDIKTIEGALELIMKLRGVTFNWISTDKPSMGLIAQEVEPVLPQVVHTAEDGTKTISYGNLVGLLVECVKAQEDRLTRLENLVLHKA